MRCIQATELRSKLFGVLSEVAENRQVVEVIRHGRPIAVLAPSQGEIPEAGKPSIPLGAISSFCRAHRLVGFYLFGSILTDSFRDESDVDVMIDTGGRSLSFDETCQMLDELESIFGRKVDMLTKGAVESMTNQFVRASILATAALIFRHV
jgi:uncharacterized protein